jgi:hypothetical protein
MSKPTPIYLGQYPALVAGDIRDFGMDIDADLDAAEAISSVAFTVTLAGVVTAGVVTDSTITSPAVDFRVAAPATAGGYLITAVFTIDDGQQITHTADLWVV